MLRLMRDELAPDERRGFGTAMSVTVHVVLITAAVVATNPPEGMMKSLYNLANRVIYIAPPTRVPSTEGSIAQLQFIDAAPIGLGSGFARGAIPSFERQPDHSIFTANPGDMGKEIISTIEQRKYSTADSVFTIAEVDSAVSIDPTSAAPEYPPALLKLGVEGSVMVRYVVDSTGVADMSSLEIVRATRAEFALAVREALPMMHFTPARIGPKRVNQLVEQPFNFRIVKPVIDSTKLAPVKGKKPPA